MARRRRRRLRLATVYRTLWRLTASELVRELRFQITGARVKLVGYCAGVQAAQFVVE
jgi:Fe2+ or Zn2+ uptake regulation protein